MSGHSYEVALFGEFFAKDLTGTSFFRHCACNIQLMCAHLCSWEAVEGADNLPIWLPNLNPPVVASSSSCVFPASVEEQDTETFIHPPSSRQLHAPLHPPIHIVITFVTRQCLDLSCQKEKTKRKKAATHILSTGTAMLTVWARSLVP